MAVKSKLSKAQEGFMKTLADSGKRNIFADRRSTSATGKVLAKKGLVMFLPVLGWVPTAAGWQWLRDNAVLGGDK